MKILDIADIKRLARMVQLRTQCTVSKGTSLCRWYDIRLCILFVTYLLNKHWSVNITCIKMGTENQNRCSLSLWMLWLLFVHSNLAGSLHWPAQCGTHWRCTVGPAHSHTQHSVGTLHALPETIIDLWHPHQSMLNCRTNFISCKFISFFLL